MDVKQVSRYFKHFEFSIWSLIVFLGILINFSGIESLIQHEFAMNILLGVISIYTLVHFRLIPAEKHTSTVIVASTLIFTTLTLCVVHFSGSFDSIFFPVIYIPILFSMMMAGWRVVLIVGFYTLAFLSFEFLIYFLPLHGWATESIRILLDRVIGLVIVTYISYVNTQEVLTRAKENLALQEEKEKIHAIQQREETIFQSIQDMVIALDKTGKVILSNRSFENTMGLPRIDILNKHYRDLFNIFEIDHLGNLIAEIDLLLTKEFSIFFSDAEKNNDNRDLKLVSKHNQKEVFIELTNSPLSAETDQTVEGAVVVMRDVTDQKQLDKMKLDFVSMAAHELRTPITAVRGYLSALKEEAWNVLNEEQKRFVDRADIASIQLATLMENLLSVSRIERGSFNLDRRETDWKKLVEQRVEEFQTRAEAHGLALIYQAPPVDIPKVFVDPLRIIEVLNNLISNAINYTNEGRVEVRVEYDPKEEVVITNIQDTGQGVPQDALPHMFEKFFRVSGVLEQGSKGTGLGLYISKQIAELHGGKIWVQSKVDIGSTFSFSVPTINNKNIQEALKTQPQAVRQAYHGQRPTTNPT
ncbi:PAS domain-containing protein [candidate division WWE3 bacterium]|nr:PAS domain-containing protein [candidate division WWE3 bacterium]